MTAVDPTKPSIHLLIIDLQTGQRTQIKSVELNIFGKVADIVFRQASQPLPATIEIHLMEKIAKDKSSSSTGITQICWHEEMERQTQTCQNVKRVFINYYIPLAGPLPNEPGEYKEPYKAWLTLIPLIGTICREMFPNLAPEESNFNVHVGFYHYHEDAHLLPDTSTNRINLKQR